MTDLELNTLTLSALSDHQETFERLTPLIPSITSVGKLCAEALNRGKKIMFCGNGGSAADAQHLAAELTGRFVSDRRPLAGLALTTDSSALTCIGNDYSFAHIFSRQVAALGQPGDVLIGISTSGESENILSAVRSAKEIGIMTVGLSGKDGGCLCKNTDYAIIAPSKITARIQECHIFIGHMLCALMESEMGFSQSS